MIVMWMELVLGIAVGCLIMIAWLAWDLARWGELHIDLSMEEIESDLWDGLHLYDRDDE